MICPDTNKECIKNCIANYNPNNKLFGGYFSKNESKLGACLFTQCQKVVFIDDIERSKKMRFKLYYSNYDNWRKFGDRLAGEFDSYEELNDFLDERAGAFHEKTKFHYYDELKREIVNFSLQYDEALENYIITNSVITYL